MRERSNGCSNGPPIPLSCVHSFTVFLVAVHRIVVQKKQLPPKPPASAGVEKNSIATKGTLPPHCPAALLPPLHVHMANLSHMHMVSLTGMHAHLPA